MQLKCTVADIAASSPSSTKEETVLLTTTTTTMNKWSSSSSSPNNHDDKSPSSSSSSPPSGTTMTMTTTTTTTTKTTTMTTIYRNNAHLIYPFTVDPTHPEHLIHVAIALCPELLLNATTTDNDKDDDNLALPTPPSTSSSSHRELERKKYHHHEVDEEEEEEEEATTKSLSSSSSSSSSSARRRSHADDDDDEDSDDSSDDLYNDEDDNHHISVVIGNDHDDKRKKEDDTNRLLSMFSVQPLTGGLSNELFIVTNRLTDNKVLVRIHPTIEKEDHDDNINQEIVDRSMENRLVAWLSAVGDAPLYYGRFYNGRVEEFYHNHMTLSWNQMKDYAIPIASVLANVHAKIVPSHIFSPPGDASSVAGYIWHRGDVWLRMAYDRLCHSHAPSRHHKQEEIVLFLQLLEKEWKWLKQHLMNRIVSYNTSNNENIHDTSTTNNSISTAMSPEQILVQQFCAQIVLTHMDCQSLNLLRKEGTTSSSLRLIDYEYAGYNPRAADIANTFCEYCNMNQLCAHYENEYPTSDVQHEFMISYVRTLYATTTTPNTDPILHTLYELLCHHPSSLNDNNDIHSSHPTFGYDKDLLLQELCHEIGQYTLISHITWSIWSIVQLLSIHQSIDFDYMAYAQQRMKGYEYFRQRYNFCVPSHS